jgi:hypothetical protein
MDPNISRFQKFQCGLLLAGVILTVTFVLLPFAVEGPRFQRDL